MGSLRSINAYNLQFYDESKASGIFNLPKLDAEQFIPKRMIGFNYALTTKKRDTGVHFYLDDYQFECFWNRPEVYFELLRGFDCVLTPDFSLYLDMPMVMKGWNVFRSRLLGQAMQCVGLRVIPTVSWAEPETFEWCFDGLPKDSTVSVSTIGVKKNKNAERIWKQGMDAMIDRIHPSCILVYGGKNDYDYGDTRVVFYENPVTRRMEYGR